MEKHRLIELVTTLLAIIVIVGCGPSLASTEGLGLGDSAPKTAFYCMDVSGSTEDVRGQLLHRIRYSLLNEKSPKVEIHRFDRNVHELYTGAPIHDEERLTKELKNWFAPVSGGRGTSLANMIHRIDSRLQSVNKPCKVVVVSDCGTELTSSSETDRALRTTEGWAKKNLVTEIRVIGVRPGQREAIRRTIADALLRFEDE